MFIIFAFFCVIFFCFIFILLNEYFVFSVYKLVVVYQFMVLFIG